MLSGQLLLRYCRLQVICVQAQVPARQSSRNRSQSDINAKKETATDTKTHVAKTTDKQAQQFTNNTKINNGNDTQNINKSVANSNIKNTVKQKQISFVEQMKLQNAQQNSANPSRQWLNRRITPKMQKTGRQESVTQQLLYKKLNKVTQEIGTIIGGKNNSVSAELMQQIEKSRRPTEVQDFSKNESFTHKYTSEEENFEENSWSYRLTNAKSVVRQTGSTSITNSENTFKNYNHITFVPQMSDTSRVSEVELPTWNAELEKYLQYVWKSSPSNGFEEMIDWTQKGMLWKFPINNEQGIETENSVHFSEHVFLDRHLNPWCPAHGPIRHFMDLVCIGLSNNPYITVNEKIDHIMWYRNYFAEKSDLLLEMGVITEAITKPEKGKRNKVETKETTSLSV